MEEYDNHDRDIAYSRTVKAGKRIYYLDVKRSRNEDLYLSLTESKKKVSGNPESPDVSFEKHKIFLYREDLSKFTEALIDVIRFINDHDSEQEYSHLQTKNSSEISDDNDADPIFSSEIDENDMPIKLNMGDFE